MVFLGRIFAVAVLLAAVIGLSHAAASSDATVHLRSSGRGVPAAIRASSAIFQSQDVDASCLLPSGTLAKLKASGSAADCAAQLPAVEASSVTQAYVEVDRHGGSAMTGDGLQTLASKYAPYAMDNWVPPTHLLVAMPLRTLCELQCEAEVKRVIVANAWEKIADELWSKTTDDDGATVSLAVTIMKGAAADDVAAICEGVTEQWPATTCAVTRRRVFVRGLDGGALLSALEFLSSQPTVDFIEENAEHFFTSNAYARRLVQSGLVGGSSDSATNTPVYAHGITGAGQIVHIGDSGVDVESCFFRDANVSVKFGALMSDANPAHRKVLWYDDFQNRLDDSESHGTHVAGTAVGKSITDNPAWNGVAYDAKLAFTDLGDGRVRGSLTVPDPFSQLYFPDPYRVGARISSNSWGISAFGAYTVHSSEVDTFVWEQPDFLVLFAAGNAGPSTETINSPATCKNCLSVGASLNPASSSGFRNSVASFSSRGPASDGRIKPELLGPGHSVISANSQQAARKDGPTCSVASQAGTSMATPVIAGAAALVRQYFTEGFHVAGAKNVSEGFEPTAALVKAVLIHSAEALATQSAAPNNAQGYGIVNLKNALSFSDDAVPKRLYVLDNKGGITSGLTRQLCFTVHSADAEFRATLVWMDAPPASRSGKTLVNDLDLEVEDDLGTIRYGNDDFSGTPTSGDRINNVERVIVYNPQAPQTYRVRVRTHAVTGSQPYALVVTGDMQLDDSGSCAVPACPFNCSSRGVCEDDTCQCNAGYAGRACETEVDDVRLDGGVISSVVESDRSLAFRVSVPSVSSTGASTLAGPDLVTISARSADDVTIEVLVKAGSAPTLSDYDAEASRNSEGLFTTTLSTPQVGDHYILVSAFTRTKVRVSVCTGGACDIGAFSATEDKFCDGLVCYAGIAVGFGLLCLVSFAIIKGVQLRRRKRRMEEVNLARGFRAGPADAELHPIAPEIYDPTTGQASDFARSFYEASGIPMPAPVVVATVEEDGIHTHVESPQESEERRRQLPPAPPGTRYVVSDEGALAENANMTEEEALAYALQLSQGPDGEDDADHNNDDHDADAAMDANPLRETRGDAAYSYQGVFDGADASSSNGEDDSGEDEDRHGDRPPWESGTGAYAPDARAGNGGNHRNDSGRDGSGGRGDVVL